MSFISLHFFVIVFCLFSVYYILPSKFQPYLLLLGNIYFYYRSSGKLLLILAATSFVAYFFGHLLEKKTLPYRKILLFLAIICLLSPLYFLKYNGFVLQMFGMEFTDSLVLPMGISFYTLQLIAYIVDVYKGTQAPEKNFFRFFLFASFFPQIIQGPIPRFKALSETLFQKHKFDEKTVFYGLQKILWGIFFKFMIASKSAVLVDDIFNSQEYISGSLYLTAGLLYSFQLYADFISCVYLAQGVSLLFGVKLSENFAQPYLADSIKDFWRRWHISLSNWLRDYVYIPLGGNRKGNLRTNINLLITFFVSGIWHGAGLKYIVWGLMHGIYQLIGKFTFSFRNRIYTCIKPLNTVRSVVQKLATFILVTAAWIIFRANTIESGLHALHSIVFDFHAEELFDGTLFTKGLNVAEFILLLICIVFLLLWDYVAEKGKNIMEYFNNRSTTGQLIYAFLLLFIIVVFGTYGYGYDASSFIYGGF